MKKPPTRRQMAYWRSAELRLHARRQCQKMSAVLRVKPRCGAVRKRDGEPCQQVAMTNGRCHYHGGATPKGKDWHRLQKPAGDGPAAAAKVEAKIRQHGKAAAAKDARLARMTPEQRAAHQEWQRTHRPGDPAVRKRLREERRQNRAMAELIARQKREEEAAAEERRRRQAELECEHRMALETITQPDGGIFG